MQALLIIKKIILALAKDCEVVLDLHTYFNDQTLFEVSREKCYRVLQNVLDPIKSTEVT